MKDMQVATGRLSEGERRRFRDAMIQPIREGKPNPFEPDSPAYASYAFTKALLGKADQEPDSTLGKQAADALGLMPGLTPTAGNTPSGSRRRGLLARSGSAPVPEEKPDAPVAASPNLPLEESDAAMPPLPPEPPERPVPITRIAPVSEAFANAIFAEESRGTGGYGAVNRNDSKPELTALGRYQMQRAALVSVGFQRPDGSWTGALGVNEEDDFLNNPHAQDVAFSAYMEVAWQEMRTRETDRWIGYQFTDQSGVLRTVTQLGLIAAAHREGSYAFKKFLEFVAENDGSLVGVTIPDELLAKGHSRSKVDIYPSVSARLARFQQIPYLADESDGIALLSPTEPARK